MKKLFLLILLGLLYFNTDGLAKIISINFNNGTATLLDNSDICGVAEATNWNNIYNNGGTGLQSSEPIGLVDSDGIDDGTSLTYKVGYSFYNSNGWGSQADKNYKMMEGWFGLRDDDDGFIIVNNIPPAMAANGYDVYVYFDSNASSSDPRNMNFNIGTYNLFGMEIYRYAGEFIESAGDSFANATVGNYVVFRGLTGTDMVLNGRCDSTYRATINGIQIVETDEKVLPGAISINFNKYSDTELASDAIAGVEPLTNWNNFNEADGLNHSSDVALIDNKGIASGAMIRWQGGSAWENSDTGSGGNDKMMKGYYGLDVDAGDYITVSNIPLSLTSVGYNVYVYYNSDENNRTMWMTIAGETIVGIETGADFAGDFIEADNSQGNYVVYRGLDSDNFTLTAYASSNRAAINGIQIIPVTPTVTSPSPANNDAQIPIETGFSWQGRYVDFEPVFNLYYGVDAENLSLKAEGLVDGQYQPTEPLQLDTQYFWRVDMIDGSTDPATVYPGHIWSFKSYKNPYKVIHWAMEQTLWQENNYYIVDGSGWENDGLIVAQEPNQVDFGIGVVGNAIKLDGDASVNINSANGLPLEVNDSWTMTVFVKVGSDRHMLTRIAGFGDEDQRELMLSVDGSFAFLYQGSEILDSNIKPEINRWYSLAVVCKAGQDLSLYVDGQLAAQCLLPIDFTSPADDALLARTYAKRYSFVGSIDEFIIWDDAISQMDIELEAGKLPMTGDANRDRSVNLYDVGLIANDWMADNYVSIANVVLADFDSYVEDEFEIVADNWATGSLVLLNEQGNNALSWDYDLGDCHRIGFEYTPSIISDDFAGYVSASILAKRLSGDSGSLYCSLYGADGGLPVTVEYPGGIEALPLGQWQRWDIDLADVLLWRTDSIGLADGIGQLAKIEIGCHSQTGGAGNILFDDIVLTGTGQCYNNFNLTDMDSDCIVTVNDFAIIAHSWLDSE
ncbi:MAG: LamG domain-containing protein [Phycisphaerae bacterium]|nr:LamG domain-containing protein [Phycisphaerae bacterium]